MVFVSEVQKPGLIMELKGTNFMDSPMAESEISHPNYIESKMPWHKLNFHGTVTEDKIILE